MPKAIPEAFELLRLGYHPTLPVMVIGELVPVRFETAHLEDPMVVEGLYRVVGQDSIGYELEYIGDAHTPLES